MSKPHKSGLYRSRIQYRGKRYEAYGITQEEADEKLARKVRPLIDCDLGVIPPPTLKSWMEDWRETKKGKGYQRQITFTINRLGALGDNLMSELTRSKIQAWMDVQEGATNTLKHLKSVLHNAIGAYFIDDETKANPVSKVRIPRRTTQKARPLPLTVSEVKRFIGEPGAPASRTIVLTGILGIGWEEIRAIAQEDYDGERLWIGRAKTTARPRYLPVPERVRPYLDAALPWIGASDSSVHKALHRRAGKPIGRHALRHFCSTTLAEIGCPFHIIASILGHKVPGETTTYIDSNYLSQKSEWLGRLADMVLGSNGGENGVQKNA